MARAAGIKAGAVDYLSILLRQKRRLHINLAMGPVRVAKLTPRHIENMMADFVDGGGAPRSAAHGIPAQVAMDILGHP